MAGDALYAEERRSSFAALLNCLPIVSLKQRLNHCCSVECCHRLWTASTAGRESFWARISSMLPELKDTFKCLQIKRLQLHYMLLLLLIKIMCVDNIRKINFLVIELDSLNECRCYCLASVFIVPEP